MMRRLALIAVLVATCSTGHADEPSSTQTRAYVGGPGPYTYATICQGQLGNPYGISIACFERSSAASVSVVIEDATGLPVAANTWTIDRAGDVVYGRRFCGSSGPISLVPGWTRFYVFLAGPAEAAAWCLGWQEQGYPATRGTVRATFS